VVLEKLREEPLFFVDCDLQRTENNTPIEINNE